MLSTIFRILRASVKNQYPFKYVTHFAEKNNEIFYLEKFLMKFDVRVGYLMLGTIQENGEVDWKIFTSYPPYFMGIPWKKVKNNNVAHVAQAYVKHIRNVRRKTSGRPVQFVDSNLEKSIRHQLNKGDGPLTDTDMVSMVNFDSDDFPIVNIKDLDQAHNLHTICINNCPNLQKEEISHFVKVHNVEMQNCGIYDLQFLTPLTKLFFLKLYKNHIRDLTPLEALPHLEHLYIANNKITDVTPLNKSKKLVYLNLDHNPTQNLNELRSNSIKYLRICHNPNQDLRYLPDNLKELQHFVLDQSQMNENMTSVVARLRNKGVRVEIENSHINTIDVVS